MNGKSKEETAAVNLLEGLARIIGDDFNLSDKIVGERGCRCHNLLQTLNQRPQPGLGKPFPFVEGLLRFGLRDDFNVVLVFGKEIRLNKQIIPCFLSSFNL